MHFTAGKEFSPPDRTTRRVRFVRMLAIVSCLVYPLLAGCRGEAPADRTSRVSTSDEDADGTSVSAADTLRQCIEAYRCAQSYSDEGQVVLRYRMEGKREEDRAPMRVAIDRSTQRLGLAVYSVTAGPSGGRWYLRCNDQDPRIEGQILSRRLPGRLSWNWLLEDPIVAEKLTAGLAGFPVQLNLLLSDRPLAGLLDDAGEVQFDPPGNLDGRSCLRISVHRKEGVYRLWIDRATRLIRRIEFPRSHVSETMVDDHRVSDIELLVDLAGARTDGPVDWSQFQVQPRNSEMRLVRFVPKLEFEPDPLLGETPPAFSLSNPEGQVVFRSEQQYGQRGTLLLWLADHPASHRAAELFSQIAAALKNNNLHDRFSFVSVWAEPQPAEGTTFATLPTQWGLPGRFAVDRLAVGRDLFGVMTAPSLVILDDRGRIQLRMFQLAGMHPDAVLGLLGRLASGEDAGRAQRIAHQNSLKRHAAELQIATSSDATPRYDALRDYDPVLVRVGPPQPLQAPGRIAGATTDASDTWWCLGANGDVHRFARPSSEPPTVVARTPWRPEGSGSLAIAPSGRWIAWYDPTLRRLELFNVRSETIYSPEVPTGTDLVDMQWVPAQNGIGPVLAALMSNRQILICDPAQRIQLCGRSDGRPLALVHNPARPGREPLLVLADGGLQPWSLDGALRAASLAPTGDRLPPLAASGRLASHTSADPERPPKPLAIRPADGPWIETQSGGKTLLLGRGWLESDEPALFLLDSDLQPVWHYRIGLQTAPVSPRRVDVAQDPATGQAVWLYIDHHQTTYVLRQDGLCDHFRRNQRGPTVAAGYRTEGDALFIELVYPDAIIRHRIDWQ